MYGLYSLSNLLTTFQDSLLIHDYQSISTLSIRTLILRICHVLLSIVTSIEIFIESYMNIFYITVVSIAVVDKYMIIMIIESIKAINRLLSIYIINSTNLSPTILLNWKSYQDINDVNYTLDDYRNYYKNKYYKEIEKFKLTLQVSHLHNKNSNNHHHHHNNHHHNSHHHDDHHIKSSRSYKGKRSGIMLVIQKPTINSKHNIQLSSKITNSHIDSDQSIDTSHIIQPTIIQDITQQNLRTTPEGLKLSFIYRENLCLDDNSEVFYNNDSIKTPEHSKNCITTPLSSTVASSSSSTAKMARVTTTPITAAAVMSSTTTTTVTSIAIDSVITTPVRRRPLLSSPYDSTLHSTPSTDRTRHTERQQQLLMSSSSSSSNTSPVVMMNSGGGGSRSRYSSPILPYNVDRLQSNCSGIDFAKTTSKVPSSPSVMNGHDVGSCNSCQHHSTTTNDRSESVDKAPLDDDNQHNNNNNNNSNSISGSNFAIDDDDTRGVSERLINVDDGLNQEASRHNNLYRMMSTTTFSVQSISPIDAMKLGEVTLFLFCITMLVASTQCSHHYDVIIHLYYNNRHINTYYLTYMTTLRFFVGIVYNQTSSVYLISLSRQSI